MNVNLAANGGSVEVSDEAFGREFNEADKVAVHKRTAQRYVAAVANLGVKRVRVAHARAPYVHPSGEVAA